MHSSGQLQQYVDLVVNTSMPMNVVSVVSEQGKQSLHFVHLRLKAANQSQQHMAALIQCKATTHQPCISSIKLPILLVYDVLKLIDQLCASQSLPEPLTQILSSINVHQLCVAALIHLAGGPSRGPIWSVPWQQMQYS